MSRSSTTALLLLLWSCATAAPPPTGAGPSSAGVSTQAARTTTHTPLRPAHEESHQMISNIDALRDFLKDNAKFQIHPNVEEAEKQLQNPVVTKAVGVEDLPRLLYKKLAQHEVPVGVTNKLLHIQHYERICFLIDNSFSMTERVWECNNVPKSGRDKELVALSDELHKMSLANRLRNPDTNIKDLPRITYQNILTALKNNLKPGETLSHNHHADLLKWMERDVRAVDVLSPMLRDQWRDKRFVRHEPSRWSEACYQILQMLDILQYLPKPDIDIHFLNGKKTPLTLKVEEGSSPQQFYNDSRLQIMNAFAQIPYNGTPMLERIQDMMNASRNKKVIHYWFGDGEPNGGKASVEKIKDIVVNRPNPQLTPITLVSCSNNDDEIAWMKEVEEIAPYCAEIDDYESELQEVVKDQGQTFRTKYTYGLYLACLLVGAMNPDDLDALDESVPLTKYSLELVLGYTEGPPYTAYEAYFCRVIRSQESHPDRRLDMVSIVQKYDEFVKDGKVARDVPGVLDFKKCLKTPVLKISRTPFAVTSVQDYLSKLSPLDIEFHQQCLKLGLQWTNEIEPLKLKLNDRALYNQYRSKINSTEERYEWTLSWNRTDYLHKKQVEMRRQRQQRTRSIFGCCFP